MDLKQRGVSCVVCECKFVSASSPCHASVRHISVPLIRAVPRCDQISSAVIPSILLFIARQSGRYCAASTQSKSLPYSLNIVVKPEGF